MSRFLPIVFLAVLTLILFFPFLFQGKMPSGQEDPGYYYPALFFYQKAIQNGESFLWDNSYYGGFPSFLNYFGGFLYPLHYVLFRFLPFFAAYGLAMALPVFGGMAFSYLFGRVNSFSVVGSLILALGYTTGSTLTMLDTGLSPANGFLLLPLLLFLIFKTRGADNFLNTFLFVFLGIIGSAIGFVAGFPQAILYGVTFAFFYALYLDLTHDGLLSWRSFKGVALFFLMIFGGALIAAPQLIATFDYLDLSLRVAGYTALVTERPPLGVILFFLLPPIFDVPRLIVNTSGLYIGVFPLFFSILAAVFFRNRLVIFFGLSYLVMLAMFFDIPPFSWWNDYVPFFSGVSNPARWIYVGVFSLSFLAAYGYELFKYRFDELSVRKSFIRFFRGAGIISFLGFLGAAIIPVLLYFLKTNNVFQSRALDFFLWFRDLPILSNNYQWFRGVRLPYEHYQSVFSIFIDQSFSDTAGNVWFWIGAAFLPLSYFVIKSRISGLPVAWFDCMVVSLVTLNTALVFIPYFSQMIPQKILLEEPAAVRVIKEREKNFEDFRVLPFLSGEGVFRKVTSKNRISVREAALINREILTGQIQGIYGLDSIGGYEPLQSSRQNRLIDTVIAPHHVGIFDEEAVRRGAFLSQKVNNEALKPVTLEEKIADLSDKLPLLSMMNVKYILSPYASEDVRLKEIEMPLDPDIPLKLHLYENTEVAPRIYFANNPVFWSGDDRDLLLEVAETKDFGEKTFIECHNCDQKNTRWKSSIPSSNKFIIREYMNGKLELDVDNENDEWLVFSESNLPGWVAGIDGTRTQIYPANYLFQSIFVPAGRHEIKFEYLGTFKLRLERIRNIFE